MPGTGQVLGTMGRAPSQEQVPAQDGRQGGSVQAPAASAPRGGSTRGSTARTGAGPTEVTVLIGTGMGTGPLGPLGRAPSTSLSRPHALPRPCLWAGGGGRCCCTTFLHAYECKFMQIYAKKAQLQWCRLVVSREVAPAQCCGEHSCEGPRAKQPPCCPPRGSPRPHRCPPLLCLQGSRVTQQGPRCLQLHHHCWKQPQNKAPPSLNSCTLVLSVRPPGGGDSPQPQGICSLLLSRLGPGWYRVQTPCPPVQVSQEPAGRCTGYTGGP